MRGGCRGFIGPFPLPLWMRSSVVQRSLQESQEPNREFVVRFTRRPRWAGAAAAMGRCAHSRLDAGTARGGGQPRDIADHGRGELLFPLFGTDPYRHEDLLTRWTVGGR